MRGEGGNIITIGKKIPRIKHPDRRKEMSTAREELGGAFPGNLPFQSRGEVESTLTWVECPPKRDVPENLGKKKGQSYGRETSYVDLSILEMGALV